MCEKIIVGPHGVPDPPSLAQMTFTQCTSMSELKFDSGAPNLAIYVILGTYTTITSSSMFNITNKLIV